MTYSAAAPQQTEPAVVALDFLDDNLSSLALGPLLAERVRRTERRGHIVRTRDGTPIVSVEGALIGAPLSQAEILATAEQATPDTAFIVFGLGAGHVARGLRDVSPRSIVVFEPDLGLLRTVLEHGPTELGGYTLVTSVHDLAAAWATLPSRPTNAVVVVTPGYAALFPEHLGALRSSVHDLLQRVQITENTYRRRSQTWIRDVLSNVDVLAEAIPFGRLKGEFENVPAFIVGAGPSLDENIHLLSEATEKGIVFCVNSSSRPLAKRGIEPQVLACIESLDSSELLAELPFIDRVIRAFSLTAAPALLRTGRGPLLPIYESLPQLNGPLSALTGVCGLSVCGSVSTIAFSLAEHLGCSPIVLVGQDLAYTTGRTHAGGTWWEASRASVSEATGEVRLEWSEALKKVGHRHDHEPLTEITRWGGGGTVFSGASFSGIRSWFEGAAELLANLRPELTLVNSTEGGARLEGFEERPLAEVLAGLPARHITAAAIAARAGELARPLSRRQIASWLEHQRARTAEARRAARRVRRIGSHAVAAIRADDPLAVTRTFRALEHEERGLRTAVQASPFLDAWCHADVHQIMTGSGESEADARTAALRATERGVQVATVIEQQARALERELCDASGRNAAAMSGPAADET